MLFLYTGGLVCLACGSDDQLLLPLAQIPRCVHQLYHLRVGHISILPQTQSKSATFNIVCALKCFIIVLLYCIIKL